MHVSHHFPVQRFRHSLIIAEKLADPPFLRFHSFIVHFLEAPIDFGQVQHAHCFPCKSSTIMLSSAAFTCASLGACAFTWVSLPGLALCSDALLTAIQPRNGSNARVSPCSEQPWLELRLLSG